MKKEYSEEEIRAKAETYCSVAERCRSEVRNKLQQWGALSASQEDILVYLEQERFIDEYRYAKAFVRDKYRFSQWGRLKIIQALRLKFIPEACIKEGLMQIDDNEYLSILNKLLMKKKRTIKYNSDYELNGKLIRFAAGHGYEMGEILSCLKQADCCDEYMD